MDIYFRKPVVSYTFEELKKKIRKQLKTLSIGKQVITIWGAGAKTSHFTNLLDEINIAHIVDSSKAKAGQYCNAINVPIETVSPEVVRASDLILLFATSYAREILEQLRGMGFCGDVALVEDGGIKVVKL
jgi:hypothetical protein